MKQCFKCKEVKSLGEFYAHPAMKDGHLGKCKQCTKIDSTKHRAANLEKVQEYDRKRGNLPHRKAARAEYRKLYRASRPQQAKANALVNKATASGKLKKQPCQDCGHLFAEAHHTDYSKPLDVQWLCTKCHHAKHRKYDYSALLAMPNDPSSPIARQ